MRGVVLQIAGRTQSKAVVLLDNTQPRAQRSIWAGWGSGLGRSVPACRWGCCFRSCCCSCFLASTSALPLLSSLMDESRPCSRPPLVGVNERVSSRPGSYLVFREPNTEKLNVKAVASGFQLLYNLRIHRWLKRQIYMAV